jgi:hypothetical protein
MARKSLPEDQNILGSTIKEWKKVKAYSCLTMLLSIKENWRRTWSTVKVCISGQMGEYMREIGRTTRCMDMEFTLGRTGWNTRANISMIRNTALEFSLGSRAKYTKESGKMANSMELVSSLQTKVR